MSFAVTLTVAFLTLSGASLGQVPADSLSTGTVPAPPPPVQSLDIITSSPACRSVTPPPRELETQSKYNENDPTRSAVDEVVIEERNTLMEPVRKSVRKLAEMAYANRDDEELRIVRAGCVISNLVSWAKAKSFTEMRSDDALLNRDRLVSEIALAFNEAQKVLDVTPEDMATIAPWLRSIAESTIEFYQYQVDRKSAVNNHRYWAGLSVAAIGYTIDEDSFVAWGKGSYDIGACQVDGQGFLPMELARGRKALEYHFYALRPLLALEKLASDNGDRMNSKCKPRIELLKSVTLNAISDSSAIERAAGYVQEFGNKERSFSRGLQLVSFGIIPQF